MKILTHINVILKSIASKQGGHIVHWNAAPHGKQEIKSKKITNEIVPESVFPIHGIYIYYTSKQGGQIVYWNILLAGHQFRKDNEWARSWIIFSNSRSSSSASLHWSINWSMPSRRVLQLQTLELSLCESVSGCRDISANGQTGTGMIQWCCRVHAYGYKDQFTGSTWQFRHEPKENQITDDIQPSYAIESPLVFTIFSASVK